MNIKVYEEKQKKKVILEGVSDFDPIHTFDCGQCFRWDKQADGSYIGVAFQKVIQLSKTEDTVILHNANMREFETIWKPYLDLERKYGEIKEALSDGDPVMKRASEYGWGIRLLQQDPWETMVSFIISQNSNIPRIKRSIDTLCRLYGPNLGTYNGKEYYGFPSPEALASLPLNALEKCKLGYRDKYVHAAARKVAADGEDTLRDLIDASIEEGEEYLRSIMGIGPKVANCILLFGLYQYDSFPLDVWMKRVMHRLYHIEMKDVNRMMKYAREHFAPYSGMAQQYLFYYARENKHLE